MEAESFGFKGCNVKKLVVGPLDVNCYMAWDKKTRDAVIIDPGGDGGFIEEEAENEGLKPGCIINTHGHFDHAGANSALRDFFGTKVAIHSLDAPLLETIARQSSFFGFDCPPQPPPDILLADGDEIKAGGIIFKILHTPGHTEGGISIYIESAGIVFTGDTLFAGSVGRTDLAGGSLKELMGSIKGILSLGDDITVFPGHGPATTIGEEKLSNPFIREIL
ncbi:MAG: MBL fold metallo-hydrolase [Deltaproteobacteria bacterium]|nr:MBL fold metallo-hydrolase [Deltaproteobacteria bacterium]